MSGNCGVTDAVAAVPGPYVRPSVASEVHDCGRTVFVRAEPASVDDTSRRAEYVRVTAFAEPGARVSTVQVRVRAAASHTPPLGVDAPSAIG